MGSVFGFAKQDLDEKISLLKSRASESDVTLKEAIHADFENDKAYAGCSNSRTLHRVTNAVKFVHLLLKDLMKEESKKEHLRYVHLPLQHTYKHTYKHTHTLPNC